MSVLQRSSARCPQIHDAVQTSHRPARRRHRRECTQTADGLHRPVSEDIQGHSDEFYTVDRRKDIDSAITFFLSTIPNLRFANRDDLIYETDDNGNIILGEDGKPILRYDTLEDGTKRIHGSVRALEYQSGGKTFRTTTKVYTNSFGMAEFRDFDKVYAEIYREIHDAKDFNDML